MINVTISPLSEELLDEAASFIAGQQAHEECFIAWLGYSAEEIKKHLMDLTPSFTECCVVALEQGVICGFVGLYLPKEQSILRLLGPYISPDKNWPALATLMLNSLKEKIPDEIQLAKVAFLEANQNCKRFFEENKFEIYNAEKTLVFEKHQTIEKPQIENTQINDSSIVPNITESLSFRPYQPQDFQDFQSIHPSGAYFTAGEITLRLNEENQLIMAVQDEQLVGYVYFELLPADGYAEICFLNVAPAFRNKGIGSVLIRQVIPTVFKHRWIKHIEISVRVSNLGAERLYKRLGFREKNTILAMQRDLTMYSWDFLSQFT